MYCCECGVQITPQNSAPSHIKKKWYICRECSRKRKATWRKEKPELNAKIRRRNQAKRRRELDYIELCKNPFSKNEVIDWHHITNKYVIAIPRDLHRHFNGGSRQKHRDLLESIVIQIYGEKVRQFYDGD